MEQRLRSGTPKATSGSVKPAVDLEASRDKRVQVSVKLRTDAVADKLGRRRTLVDKDDDSGANKASSSSSSWLRLTPADMTDMKMYGEAVDEAQGAYTELAKLCPTEENHFIVSLADQEVLCTLLEKLRTWLKKSRTIHNLFMEYGGGARILSCLCIQNLQNGLILHHVLSLLDFLTSVEAKYARTFIKADALKVIFTFVSQAINETYATHVLLHVLANIVSDSAEGRNQLLALRAGNGATLLTIINHYLTTDELQTTEIVRGCAHVLNAISSTRPPLPETTVLWMVSVIVGPGSPGLIFAGDSEVVCDAVIALNNLVSCGDEGVTAFLAIEKITPEVLHRTVTLLMQRMPDDHDDDMVPATQAACLGVLSGIISRTPLFTELLIRDCGLLIALRNLLSVYDPSLNEKALFILSNICVESTDRLQYLLEAGVFDWVDCVGCRSHYNIRLETCMLYCQALKVATANQIMALLAHSGIIFDAIIAVLPLTNKENKFLILWMMDQFLGFGSVATPNPVVALCMPLVPALIEIADSKEATARVNALADTILTAYLGHGDDTYDTPGPEVLFTIPTGAPDDVLQDRDRVMGSLMDFAKQKWAADATMN